MEKMLNTSTEERAGISPVRLFVDMDGTLAEFHPVDTMETLYEYGYFAGLAPHANVVQAIRNIIREHSDIEVYILSAYLSDSPYALIEKNQWLDQYLPEINGDHRIYLPCGNDKTEFIPGSVRETDFLLDDYTENLLRWSPGRGIKLLNGINHTHGTWTQDCIRYDKPPDELMANILAVMQKVGTARVQKPAPDQISQEREKELQELFWEESNDPETQLWREELTEAEAAFVDQLDKNYWNGMGNMAQKIVDLEEKNERSDGPERAPAEGNQKRDNLEASFLNSPVDAFAIYQLKDDEALRDISFEPLSWLQSIGRAVERNNYRLAYTAPLDVKGSVQSQLDFLFYHFNNEYPKDYTGRSLSVSDVIALKQEGVVTCHYVDSYEFQHLPDFLLTDEQKQQADRLKADQPRLIDRHSEHIVVPNQIGTWCCIDSITISGKEYFLMEHEKYGDEAACVILNQKGDLVLDDVWNGFSDLEDFLAEQDINRYEAEFGADSIFREPDGDGTVGQKECNLQKPFYGRIDYEHSDGTGETILYNDAGKFNKAIHAGQSYGIQLIAAEISKEKFEALRQNIRVNSPDQEVVIEEDCSFELSEG